MLQLSTIVRVVTAGAAAVYRIELVLVVIDGARYKWII